jgi:acyl-CoA synthetase (NDP forming)
MSDHFVADLVDVSATTDKPICVIWCSPVGTESAYRDVLLASEMPVFRTFRNCVTAVRAYLDFHAFQSGIATMADPETAPAPEPGRDSPTRAPGDALSELESKRLLARFGIPVTRDILCRSADEVVAAAGELGVPVVLKASSAAITHKSDLGLVRVGVRSEPEMREAFADFRRTVGQVPGARFEGVLVCEQVAGGVEAVVGIAADEMFGPVVMAGIGGAGVELYRDVSFRVPPFSRTEAHRMLSELTGSALLRGYRGAPAVSAEALVDVIMSVQRLAQQGIVAELDINPLLVTADRAVALDALAVGVADGVADGGPADTTRL